LAITLNMVTLTHNTMSKQITSGQLFKQARTDLGMTQLEVAEKAGIHSNTYAKIERDIQEPSFATIKKIAQVLKLSLEDIPA
jgi:transcriptional regulator with XRE-family HTH domain